MIFSVKFHEAKGVDKKHIHFELFTTPAKSHVSKPKPELNMSKA
jgi:hypothetical protein